MPRKRKRARRRVFRRQRGRGVGAVMALLAPVLAKTVASTPLKPSKGSEKAFRRLEVVVDLDPGGINEVRLPLLPFFLTNN